MRAEAKRQAYRYGVDAETLAAWYLRGKGYRVVATRYRNPMGEVDLLATKGQLLVAVEVKARQSIEACAESVTAEKRRRLARAVAGLLAGHGKISGLADAGERNIRFDVIWIAPRRWPKHIKDAWRL